MFIRFKRDTLAHIATPQHGLSSHAIYRNQHFEKGQIVEVAEIKPRSLYLPSSSLIRFPDVTWSIIEDEAFDLLTTHLYFKQDVDLICLDRHGVPFQRSFNEAESIAIASVIEDGDMIKVIFGDLFTTSICAEDCHWEVAARELEWEASPHA